MFIGSVTPAPVVSVSLPEKDVIVSFSIVPHVDRERRVGAVEDRARAGLAVTVITSSAVPVVISVSSTLSPPSLMSLPSPLFQIDDVVAVPRR